MNTIAKNDKEWHRLVIEEANYICVGCGKDFSFGHYFDEKNVRRPYRLSKQHEN